MLKFDPFDGALLVDKPAGPTSHDIVEIIRSQFGIAKVGHAGTLDPAATGLLILLLGRGTKLSEKLMADDKVYAGWMRLGERGGRIVPRRPAADAAHGVRGEEGRRAAL